MTNSAKSSSVKTETSHRSQKTSQSHPSEIPATAQSLPSEIPETPETELVLVTGVSGFLGTHVVKVLQEAGHKVRGTVRSVKDENKVKHLRELCPNAKYPLELVEADLMEKDCWKQAVSGCKYVVHTASPFPLANPQTADEVVRPAVDGTVAVLEACKEVGGVRRVVLTSSVIAIADGKAAPNMTFTESQWAEPGHSNFYGQSKILAEKAAWYFIEKLSAEKKFELAVVNPTFIAGPTLHGTPGASMTPVKRLLTRDMPAVPRFSLAVCDVRDVALAHMRCMLLPEAAGNRHIIHSGSIWLYELATLLDKEFRPKGYNVPTRILPGPLLTLYSLFDKEVRATKAIASHVMQIDNSRMKDVLGITPTPIEKTYIDMAYSMIENGFVNRTEKYWCCAAN